MNQTLDAVYEYGTFRVLNAFALPLKEGQRVRLTVETSTETPEDLLNLAGQVYDGLSPEEIDEVERIAFRRDFGDKACYDQVQHSRKHPKRLL